MQACECQVIVFIVPWTGLISHRRRVDLICSKRFCPSEYEVICALLIIDYYGTMLHILWQKQYGIHQRHLGGTMKKNNDNEKEYWYLRKRSTINRSICYILAALIGIGSTGCNTINDINNKGKSEEVGEVTVSPDMADSDAVSDASASPDIEISQDTEAVSDIEAASDIKAAEVEEVDYSDCFDDINGCAIFYNSQTKKYYRYHEVLCEQRSSPDSTFKIISTLIGLENEVISSVDSTMGYDGTIYSNEKWNKDLSLIEAFKESCVWYYRKLIDRIGQSEIQQWLDKLDYGNSDISEWEGNGMNSLPELKGFWLDSSLQISPKEQVDIIVKIFEGKTDFSETNISILKEVMLSQKDETVVIYGKTGTGNNGYKGNTSNGWFVGMFENNEERYYFAVHLIDDKSKGARGPKAKEIALNIISKYYIERNKQEQ